MSEPYLGQIKMIGFNFAPQGWALCDGNLLAVAQNEALFSLLGTTFGGDGRTTFGLPDLKGRDPVHVGQGPGLPNVRWGEKGGISAYTFSLSISDMPGHSHTVNPAASTGDGDSTSPSGRYPAKSGDSPELYADAPTANVTMGTTASSLVGGGQSMNYKDPFLGLNHIIALVGVYPSRN